MGFLQTSDNLVDNVQKATSNILDSKFSQFITGNGVPVLVDYYNLDDTMSTANLGTENQDQILGENSPFRFNRIKNFPIYGLKDVLPSKEEIDMGLIDMELDMDLIILPNTIRPHEFDYFVYNIPDLNIILTFRVNDFEFSTIKSNSFYKITVTLKDINDTRVKDKLDKQVVSNKTAILDNIGTQEKCIINDDTLDLVNRIDKIIRYTCDQYIDCFWDRRYNAFLYRNEDSRYITYDPYLTQFLINTDFVENAKSMYIVLKNYDNRNEVRVGYNKSIYKNLEMQDITKLYNNIKSPDSFPTTSTNPFYYYGEDIAFTLTLINNKDTNIDPNYYYIESELLERILENNPLMLNEPVKTTKSSNDISKTMNNIKDTYDKLIPKPNSDFTYITLTNVPDEDGEEEISSNEIFPNINHTNTFVFWNLIITYLNKDGCFNLLEDSGVTLEDIINIDIDGDYESFIFIPMMIYILKKYKSSLINNVQ